MSWSLLKSVSFSITCENSGVSDQSINDFLGLFLSLAISRSLFYPMPIGLSSNYFSSIFSDVYNPYDLCDAFLFYVLSGLYIENSLV